MIGLIGFIVVGVVGFLVLRGIHQHQSKCNRCYQKTPKEKQIPDVGYDDYGFQCIACATDSGLLKEVQKKEQFHKHQLQRRKEFGL